MKRTVLDFGLVGLLGLALAAGCSSSGGSASGSGGSSGNGSGGSSSSGGSNGSGGSSNGSGGSSSSGGSTGSGGSSSSGGSTGSGGSSSGSGGDSGSGSGGSSGSSCAAASADLITDFGSDTAQVGDPYKGADMGLTAPMVDTSGGSLAITLDTGAGTSATSAYPYAYIGLPFKACTDASAYKGVKFNIGGTISDGCTLQFSTVDKEHNTTMNNGTCDPTMATNSSCYASSAPVTVTSDAADVTVNFTDQMGGGADPGAAFVDPTQILGVQWQFNVPVGKTCTAMVTIKNVTFVK